MSFKRLIILFVSLVLFILTTGNQALADDASSSPKPQPRKYSLEYQREGEAVDRLTEAEKAYTLATASGDQDAIETAAFWVESAKTELELIRGGNASGPRASGGGSSATKDGGGAAPPPVAPTEPSDTYKSGERFKVFDVFNIKDKQTAFRGTSDVSPIASVLVRGANFMVKVAGVIGVLVFVIGALLMITAQGREDQIQMGKDTLFYAIIGLIIVFFSYLISVTVQAIFFK